MSMLHYVNVAIGFSLVMLLLSVVTGFAVQTWLYVLRTKSRAVGNGLVSLLEDIGFDNALATRQVNALLNKGSSIFGKKLGGALSRVSAFLLAGAPKHIGREEFVLLLLRKAVTDNELATKLGFTDETAATGKLQELEKAILEEEAKDPTLPAHVWRTNAMQATVPELASKIFARFDEVLDRVSEDVSGAGKVLGIVITLPLLLMCWPVDSFQLLNRLNNDQVLSAQLAEIAETTTPALQKAHEEFLRCQETNKNAPGVKLGCQQEHHAWQKIVHDTINSDVLGGLFGGEVTRDVNCSIPLTDKPIPFFEQCKRANLTPGIVVTWILVSLGSAFWLGLLHKVLGLRSELSNKLHAQREFRATSHR